MMQALTIYKELLSMGDPDPLYHIYAAACSYYMGLYKDAEVSALQGPKCPLQVHWTVA
jgi:intraflagellar transport protein 56